MATLKALAARMNAKADELDEEASDAAVGAAITIITSLVYDTPVDTSNALSGWQIGLGARPQARRGAFYPGERGTTYRASAQAAIADAKAILAAKQPNQTIYISNLEPYIRRLNAGYSKQHPGAFVDVAVLRGREHLRKMRQKGRP